jgi:ACT domain-containing protein
MPTTGENQEEEAVSVRSSPKNRDETHDVISIAVIASPDTSQIIDRINNIGLALEVSDCIEKDIVIELS